MNVKRAQLYGVVLIPARIVILSNFLAKFYSTGRILAAFIKTPANYSLLVLSLPCFPSSSAFSKAAFAAATTTKLKGFLI